LPALEGTLYNVRFFVLTNPVCHIGQVVVLLSFHIDSALGESLPDVHSASDKLAQHRESVIPRSLQIKKLHSHCKKRSAIIPSPAGMSLTKLSQE
jgi:hypothetical protein